ncbi:MAG: hypothetical protein M0P71_01155 [Melioribacteraceae bacterium]|nr:hypothetical protein [Melioribacteraceae bacterium]
MFNFENANEVKSYFINGLIESTQKPFSLPVSFDIGKLDKSMAVLAALKAYSDYIKTSDPYIANKMDILHADLFDMIPKQEEVE